MRVCRVLVLCVAAVVCCGGAGVQAETPGMRYQVFLPQYHIAAMPKLGLSGATPEQVDALGGSWYYAWGPNGRSTQDVEGMNCPLLRAWDLQRLRALRQS